ncbi:hypothetical protein GCM10022286_23540 [Gryllotalpicola daejeonensis]|uniref:Uncharacterized protein n=1 Tax=Gryllotalpicola daejeonensis TaxID=993087 RepID=A0ABP7ZLN7_9MICO
MADAAVLGRRACAHCSLRVLKPTDLRSGADGSVDRVVRLCEIHEEVTFRLGMADIGWRRIRADH